MPRKTWRDVARPIIEAVLQETKGKPEKEIKEALYAAYPFGERNYHPYQIWRDEIKRQRGSKKKTVTPPELDQTQTKLF